MSDEGISRDPFVIDEYCGRINRVLDYIDSHIERDLTLDELAAVANFSKYHFHRIFGAMVGETLFHFIARIRAERAAVLLVSHPKESVTDIAYRCGYSGSAVFTRAFRTHFGITPSEWRRRTAASNQGKTDSNSRQQLRNYGKAIPEKISYPYGKNDWIRRSNMEEHRVDVREMPEMTVAYVRHVGPYQGDASLFEGLWGRLMQWAQPRNLLDAETKALIVYHDNPEITEDEKLRVSVCISVHPETSVGSEIGKMTIAGGKYALAHFRLAPDGYGEAWRWVYAEWLPASGYQPDDRPCFEMYPEGDRAEDGTTAVDIVIPVRPL